jgi:hypothetical protein
MMIEFYTGNNTQFVVTQNRIYRNGEVIAEGNIKIHHLVLNEPAWFDIEQGENNPVLYLKLDKVTAVLPSQEFHKGKRCNRKAFKLSYLICEQENWTRNEEVISAVDEIHVRQILKVQHGKRLRAISPHVASQSDSLTPIQIQIKGDY